MTSVAFDYHIVAHRKGYENIRLADLTDQFNNASRQARGEARRARESASGYAECIYGNGDFGGFG
jgi:hypothetical protein